MNTGQRRNIVFRFFLSVWALLTLVLVFTLILLVNQMVEQGGNPVGTLLAGDASGTATSNVARQNHPGEAREAVLYFVSADGPFLEAERFPIEYHPQTVENCRQVLAGLAAGSTAGRSPVLPESAELKALFLLPDGELVVDFSGGILSGGMGQSSATQEALMVQGLAHTLSQPALQGASDPLVQRVRILVEGTVPVERFPAHLDLREPVTASSNWVRAVAAGPGGNG
ncbi:MAG: GerMN domain-containing protein [Candidatus Hydrogenedentes bacterium]|nr:GerMN domain-containing protein [Candidatus Hydrogenedentota bacterium]